MKARHGPAAAEEEAELAALRQQADAAAREVAATAAALASRLEAAVNPRTWARRRLAGVQARAGQAARRLGGARRSDGRRRLAGGIAAVVLVTATAVAWQRHRRG
jgi:hypothetical protein